MDLVIHNPLDTDITFSALSLIVCDTKTGESVTDFVDIEVVDDINLNSGETRTVGLYLKIPNTLIILVYRYRLISNNLVLYRSRSRMLRTSSSLSYQLRSR